VEKERTQIFMFEAKDNILKNSFIGIKYAIDDEPLSRKYFCSSN